MIMLFIIIYSKYKKIWSLQCPNFKFKYLKIFRTFIKYILFGKKLNLTFDYINFVLYVH